MPPGEGLVAHRVPRALLGGVFQAAGGPLFLRRKVRKGPGANPHGLWNRSVHSFGGPGPWGSPLVRRGWSLLGENQRETEEIQLSKLVFGGAPAKRLACENGLMGSNPTPSASYKG